MAAFLYKRILGALGVCLTLISLCYAGVLHIVQTVGTERTFYFLVSDIMATQATAECMQLQGGAGYTFACGNREYVAYSVYLSKNESEQARSSVVESGDTATCLPVRCDKLYLTTPNEKRNAQRIKGAFESL